jgi:hypothetical protein
MLQINLAEVKVKPILLPEIQPSFTKQYPLKGGHDEVTACINTLIDKGVNERTQSFNFNSLVWPVKKTNGTYRFTVDFRKTNERSPAMPIICQMYKTYFIEYKKELTHGLHQ